MDSKNQSSFTIGLEDPEYNWWIRQRIQSLNEPENIHKKFLKSKTGTLTQEDFMNAIEYNKDQFREDFLESFKTSMSKTLNASLKKLKEEGKIWEEVDEDFLNQHSTEFLERNLIQKYDEIWEKRLNPEGSNTITRENYELFMSETKDLLLEQTKLGLLEKESFFKEGAKEIDVNFREGLENTTGDAIILNLTRELSKDETNLLKETIDHKNIKALTIISDPNLSDQVNQYKNDFSTKQTNVYLISGLELEGMPKNQKEGIQNGIQNKRLSVVGFVKNATEKFIQKMTTMSVKKEKEDSISL